MKTDAYKEIIEIIKNNMINHYEMIKRHYEAIIECQDSIKRHEAKIKEVENER